MEHNNLNLTGEQNAAVTYRGGPLLCAAAAGAGKTRVLVERLVSYIRDPEDPACADDFLLLTFTRAAAGEMRERILKRLRELSRENPRDGHLREQLTRAYAAKICTIDAYCREILTENAMAAGLPGGFRIGDDAEMELLREAALEETLDRLYEQYRDQPDADFSLLSDTFGDTRGDAVLSGLITEVWRKTRRRPDPLGWLREQPKRIAPTLAKHTRVLLRQAREITMSWQREYERIKPELETDGAASAYLETWAGDTADMDDFRLALKAGWDQAVSFAEAHDFPDIASVKNKDKNDLCWAFIALRNAWKKAFGKLQGRLDWPLEDQRQDLSAVQPLLRGIVTAVETFDETLREMKERRGVLDFADVEHRTYRLLTHNGKPSELAGRYAARFREIMVDEYQDINPLQNALIEALSKGGRNIFYVGDVRQSIYRFQDADPSLMLRKMRGKVSAGHPRTVHLRKNFRSSPEILEAVNHVFSRIDCPEMGVLREKEFMASGGGGDRVPGCAAGAVELLFCKKGEGEEGAAAEAAAVAARLRALCDSGEAKPEECVILLRSPGSRVAYFRRALEDAGLGCIAPGGTSFFQRPEIMTALSALRVVDNPQNDIALLSVLRSPMAGMAPDELAGLRLLCPEASLFDCLLRDERPKAQGFLANLSRWRALAAELPPYELCARIMAETALPGRYEGLARDNLLLLPEVLLGYAGATLRGLAGWLCKAGEAGGGPTAGAEAANAVRVMSIHKSKGLEFPVVVVAGLNKRFNIDDMKGPLMIHPQAGIGLCRRDEFSEYPTIAHRAVKAVLESEMRAEELRLLYVAMTRAERKLILSAGEADGESPGGFVSRGGFMQASKVSDWLLRVRDERWKTVDGGQCADGAEENRQPAESADLPETAAQEALVPYLHEGAVDFPSKMTATGYAKMRDTKPEGADAGDEPSKPPRSTFRFPNLTGAEPPLTGAERGTALHLFMQFARYERCASPKGAEAERDRLLAEGYLTLRQAGAIDLSRVTGFFATGAGQRLLAAENLRREQQFSLLAGAEDLPGAGIPPGEKVLLQGVIDCWYEAPGGLCLMDFKTDFVRPGGEAALAERYRPQLDAYAAALRAMFPGKRILSREIVFFATGETVRL